MGKKPTYTKAHIEKCPYVLASIGTKADRKKPIEKIRVEMPMNKSKIY